MKLRRVEIKGFKSFGKPTLLEFPEGISAIVGPNGAGKCVTGETKVLLGDGTSERIDEIVNSRLQGALPMDDGLLVLGDGTEVLSLGDDMKVHRRPVQAFVKRLAPKQLVCIRTRAGRVITTTPYHPLFMLREGEVRAARADELAEGMRIAIPREVKLPEPDKTFIELLDVITAKDAIYVPYGKMLAKTVRERKGKRTCAFLEDKADIPRNTVRGLLNKQSINFSHCVKLLRMLGIPDRKIIEMIPAIKAKNSNRLCKVPWYNTPELARMLGYLLAEGRSSHSNQLWFTNGNEEVVQDYFNRITQIFGIRATINEYKTNAYDVLAYSKPAQVILEKLGMVIGGGAGDKTVTNLFFGHAGTEEIAALLNGLYCGDGYIGESCIEIVTKSGSLADAIEIALLRLGIVSRRKKTIKIATNTGFSGIYEKISFYDVENFRRFANNIDLVHPRKAKRVKKLLGRTANPNVDLLDVNDIIKQTVKEQKISVKRSKKQFPKLDAYAYNGCLPSRTGVRELVDNLFGESKSALLLRSLCMSHIFWDEISSIETVEPSDNWVYDLCVEKDHNFIANNIFVHNSNIIDSICFALGYPSRNLRATKAQELIHTGKLSVPHAKVSLVFQKENRVMEVNRKVDRKGRSVYKLNSIITNLENLHDALGKHSIPKDGFNIVMQNDVMRFIEVKPAERRQILDDISGISGYEAKKRRALEELAVVERRISDTNLILSEKKGYLDEIGKDREVAMKYRGMQEELKTGKAVYLYSALYQLENQAGEMEARMEGVTKEKDIKIIELARIDEEIDGIEQRLEVITGQIIKTTGGETGEIKGEMGALKSAIEKKQEEIQFLKGEIASQEGRQKENSEHQRGLRSQIKERGDALKKLKEEIRDVEKVLIVKEKGRDAATQGFDNSELIALEKERKAVSEALFETKKSLMVIEKELDIIGRRGSESREALKEKKIRLKAFDIELSQMDKDISRLGIEADKVGRISQELEDAKARLSELFQEFARLESEIKTIERLESQRGESESLKFVKENKGRGYIGQVSELGKAPDKYKVALEVAAGDKSRCLVVSDDKAAQFYIQGLRKQKVGRATFLPLSKIHGPQLKPAKGSGIIGFAKNLIKCEKKYQKVFDFIFGGTLVVKNLDTARSVGIGKVKMVTLEGDLIAAGGAMTGGYYQKRALTFSSTAEKSKRLDDIKGEIGKLKDRKGKLEKQLEGKEAFKLDVMREKKSNLGEKMESARDSIGELEKELGELASQEKELAARKVEAEKGVAREEKELSEIEGKMNMGALDEMKSILQTIDNEIHDLKDHKFELQTRENSIKSEVGGMQSKIKDLDSQTDEIGKSVSKFQKKIHESIDQITQSGKKLNELERKHSLVTAESQRFFKEQERLNQLMKELGEKKGALEAAVERLKNESNDLEVKKAKTDTKLEEIKSSIEGIEPPSKEQMEGVNLGALKRRVKELEGELGSIEGVNLRAVDMYEELEKQYREIKEKNQMLYVEKEKVYDLIETIEEKKKAVFYDAFYKVREHFGQIITDLYPTSEGSLRLENEADPFNSGLVIEVKPGGREGVNIDSLSGGEKTLAALAFLMATQSVTPSPFYILDEVDASLDQENVLRLVRFLKNRKQSQFILISHNPETVKHMDSVIGVHMQNGLSQVVGVNMREIEA